MKARVVVLGLVALFFTAIATLAADNFSGTWKLNEAKSKLGSGPKNSTVTYSTEGDKVKVVIDGTDASGKAIHSEWVGKYDGKDYPVTGDTPDTTRSVKKVNDRTLEATTKVGGKLTTTARIVVSADGKSRTVTVSGTDASGKKSTSVAVYDKE